MSALPTHAGVVPELLRGAWKRAWIHNEDGTRDDTSTIVWLQHESSMVDVRFSAEQLALADRGSFENCSLDDLRLLAQNDSSSGFTTCTDPVIKGHAMTATATWMNGARGGVAFQPVSSYPEPGWLEWNADGSVLSERAPSGAYTEEWHRVGASAGPFDHRALDDQHQLFTAGDLAVLVRDRTFAIPPGPLAELVDGAGHDRKALTALVDCEFSLAQRSHDAAINHYKITASTLPWRIGHDLIT